MQEITLQEQISLINAEITKITEWQNDSSTHVIWNEYEFEKQKLISQRDKLVAIMSN